MTTRRRLHSTVSGVFPTAHRIAAMTWTIVSWVVRRPHDPDYRWVGGDRRLIIDVGGNRGQSALSFDHLCTGATIVTFEPNPQHRVELRLVARLLRGRMTFQSVALGETEGEADLWVPISRRRRVTGEGSLDPLALDRARRRVHVSGHTSHRVRVRTLDSFRLAPDVIKIDVQGREGAVLRGGVQTLMAHRPLLLVEAGVADDEVAQVLEPLGYRRSGGPRNWLWSPS